MAVDAESLFTRGKDAADRGNYDYAITIFRDVLRADPTHRNSRIALRGCEMQKFNEIGGSKAKFTACLKGFGSLFAMRLNAKKPEKVIEAAENFLQHDPTNVHVLTRLARALEQLGHFEAATDTMEWARQRYPNNLNILRYLGDLLYQQHQFDKAVRCYDEIIQAKPTDREAFDRRREIQAESHLKRSRMDQGTSYRESLRDEKAANTLEREQRVSRTSEDRDEELVKAKKAVTADPNNADAWQTLGDVHFRFDQFVEAKAAYLKAFEIGKKYPAREKLGNATLRLFELMEKKAAQAAEEAGQAPDLQAKARDAKRKRLEFAIKEFEFRRKQHPTDMKLAYQLGMFYVELGGPENVQKAIQQFQAAAGSPGVKLRAQLMLGRCFAQNPKTLDMAREQITKALEGVEDPASDMGKVLMYELGQINERLQNTADAVTWYKKIFAVDAGYKDVAKKIQDLG